MRVSYANNALRLFSQVQCGSFANNSACVSIIFTAKGETSHLSATQLHD